MFTAIDFAMFRTAPNVEGQRQRSESDCDLYVRWEGTQGAMAPPWSFRVGKVEETCRAYPDLPIRSERLGTDCIRDRWHRFGQYGTLVKVIEFGERSHDVLEFDIGR